MNSFAMSRPWLFGVFLAFLCPIHADIDRNLWKTDQEIDQFYGDAADERGQKAQRESLAEWSRKIENSKEIPPERAIPLLGSALSKISRYNIYQSKDRISVYDKAREQLLSIPGHAQYFADELERERADLAPEENRSDYNNRRRLYIAETLSHLPSPETVSVLGRYLFDERDEPPPIDPRKDSDMEPVPSSTRLAYECFMNIGLRNPPVTREGYWKSADRERYAISLTRAWWEKVKSGQLTFSFLGKKMEYRIGPDGTWETIALINPPDDAPRPTRLEAEIPTPAVKSVQPANSFRPWIVGMIVVVAGGLCWWWRCRRAALRS